MRPLLLGIVMVSVAASCGGSDGSEEVAPLTVFGPYREEEANLLAVSLDQWSTETGIPVQYTGSGDFVSDLKSQVYDFASPPDIAFVPQPGLARSLLETGILPPLPDAFVDELRPRFDEEVFGLADFDGAVGGFPFRLSAKSLVWYRPDQFAERGLEIPDTVSELESIVAEHSGTATAPWCLGFQAQTATGWPATDWIEDLIAREWGTDVYHDWVDGEIAFSDDRIVSSFESFQQIALDKGRTFGGRAAILSTDTSEAVAPMFADPPGCLMFKQASFAFSWMPDGTRFGDDADVHFFVLPDDVAEEPPIVAGVDMAVAFDQRPEVMDLMRFLATPDAVRPWVVGGSFVTPLVDFKSGYYSPSDLTTSELLLDAAQVVVDGSDAMPVDFGSTLFWNELTEWIGGVQTLDELTATMDASRPAPQSD